MKVALNSYGNIPTGIGSESRWLWNLLPFDMWIQGPHPKLGWGDDVHADSPLRRDSDKAIFEVDTVVCVERPNPKGLAQVAHDAGVKVIVLANPEWTSPTSDWLPFADLVIARTELCKRHLHGLGLTNVPLLQIPVDLSEFPYRLRKCVADVIFTNGWGGVHERKGWPEVKEMLRIKPGSIEVISQRPIPGVVHRGPCTSPPDLYLGSDLVVVPSRFEGVGLTILEGMASGCLVAATDAEPMSSFIRAAYGPAAHRFLLPVASTEEVSVAGQAWLSHHVDPARSVEVIHGIRMMSSSDVQYFSMAGRAYMQEVHGDHAASYLWDRINREVR